MNTNTNLKYEKQFARAVLSGNKRYEIRKASKGYTSGRKNLVSIDGNLTDECDECDYCQGRLESNWDLQCPYEADFIPNKIYTSAYYKLIGANNDIVIPADPSNEFSLIFNQHGKWVVIDRETAEFALKNYIIKGIDYVVFEIKDVDTETFIGEEE